MSSKTKIVVLRMKEIIYTAIFIGLGIILVTLLFIMFRPKKEPQTVSSGQVQAAQASYTPGLYRASLSLGSQNADLEVAVDADHINSVSMTPLSCPSRSAPLSLWKTLHIQREASIHALPWSRPSNPAF